MTPFSTNVRDNLAFIEKSPYMAGVFKYVRFLSYISFIIFFAFVPSSTTPVDGSQLTQSQVPITSGVESHAAFPTERPVKIRKKATYLSAPGQRSKLAGDQDASLIRSILTPRLFSYTVIQQPENNPYYVSNSKKLVTEFRLAKEYNNIGLLAHNNLAGKSFKYLKVGEEIYVVHKNGHTNRYVVSAIYRFQALESTNTESRFVNLDSGETLTATELFIQMYTGAPHLTLQTCIYANGDPSWGRLFVIATPTG